MSRFFHSQLPHLNKFGEFLKKISKLLKNPSKINVMKFHYHMLVISQVTGTYFSVRYVTCRVATLRVRYVTYCVAICRYIKPVKIDSLLEALR